MDRRVAMGLLFYPRGGSAQVALYLAFALRRAGWTTELLCGSLGSAGQRTHAATFFDGISVRAADYDPALAAFERGEDPIALPCPRSSVSTWPTLGRSSWTTSSAPSTSPICTTSLHSTRPLLAFAPIHRWSPICTARS